MDQIFNRLALLISLPAPNPPYNLTKRPVSGWYKRDAWCIDVYQTFDPLSAIYFLRLFLKRFHQYS
jgi:hypothetical protein